MTRPVRVVSRACLLATILLSPVAAHAQTSSEQYAGVTSEDKLRVVAAAVNERRGEAFRRRDTAAVAGFFTPDAMYVELLPVLQVMRGRAEIQRHYDELIAAQSSNLTYNVTSAELTRPDIITVGGNYVLTAKGNKEIAGHFFQELRRDGNDWKIAMQVFARPDPVTVGEVDQYRGN